MDQWFDPGLHRTTPEALALYAALIGESARKRGRGRPVAPLQKPIYGRLPPTITLESIQSLRAELTTGVNNVFPAIKTSEKFSLVERLIEVAHWYAAGRVGRWAANRPKKTEVQLLLNDCAMALHIATGQRASLWQERHGTVHEAKAVTLARLIADATKNPLPATLRRQIQEAKRRR